MAGQAALEADDPETQKSGVAAKPLDDDDVKLLKAFGAGPYDEEVKRLEKSIADRSAAVTERVGVKESETGLAARSQWDFQRDATQSAPLLVARITKIIKRLEGATSDLPEAEWKYVISIKHTAKWVVALADTLSHTDVEEQQRVGVERMNFKIQVPLPVRIDPEAAAMQVEERPDVTYEDVGGCKEQIEKVREVVELPLTDPDRFLRLGIDPPKGVLLYGPPGTGKTLCARAVANRAVATFIRVIGSELVKRYVGEGARMVREIFSLARTKPACILFFDEVDAIGGSRHEDGGGFGDTEVQRTMLEIVNQLDGFDTRGRIKVLMATNRPDTLDPALLRPGRMDRKIEFSLPDLEGRIHIFNIHTRSLRCARDIRYDLLARLCPNTTGAELRSVCTEAGMYAIRARRKVITEKDMLDAIAKVIKGYKKFSATAAYMVYN